MPRANNGRKRHTPPHWPAGVEYLNSMVFSPSLPPRVLQFLRGTGTPGQSMPERCTIIRHINSEVHPAHGQYGLFASKKIPAGTHIVDYFGEVHINERTDSDHDLSLYRTYEDDGGLVNVGIDAARMGNEARFVNDHRGIRSRPNAVFRDRRTEGGELRMSIWSSDSEAIDKGDEILVSYGKAWWQARRNGI